MIVLDILSRAWELIVAGLLLAVFIAIMTGHGGEYSGAPADREDDGEDVPEDPDRFRDYDIADAVGAL